MKTYYVQSGIGNAKYCVNHHDGKKCHGDGSPFFDIAIFRNKINLSRFIDSLEKQGYAVT